MNTTFCSEADFSVARQLVAVMNEEGVGPSDNITPLIISNLLPLAVIIIIGIITFHSQPSCSRVTGYEKVLISLLPPFPPTSKSISPVNLLNLKKEDCTHFVFRSRLLKLPPVINKQRDTGRARGKQKDRSSVALIGTTSHTIQKCRSVPIINSPLFPSVPPCAPLFPTSPCSVRSPSISTGQSVAQLSISVTSCLSPLKLLNLQPSPN